jgi:hypothetical protein
VEDRVGSDGFHGASDALEIEISKARTGRDFSKEVWRRVDHLALARSHICGDAMKFAKPLHLHQQIARTMCATEMVTGPVPKDLEPVGDTRRKS